MLCYALIRLALCNDHNAATECPGAEQLSGMLCLAEQKAACWLQGLQQVDPFSRLCIVAAAKPHLVAAAASHYVATQLGPQFTEPIVVELSQVRTPQRQTVKIAVTAVTEHARCQCMLPACWGRMGLLFCQMAKAARAAMAAGASGLCMAPDTDPPACHAAGPSREQLQDAHLILAVHRQALLYKCSVLPGDA